MRYGLLIVGLALLIVYATGALIVFMFCQATIAKDGQQEDGSYAPPHPQFDLAILKTALIWPYLALRS